MSDKVSQQELENIKSHSTLDSKVQEYLGKIRNKPN